MSKIGLFNMAFGFLLIFIAAMGGVFVAQDLNEGYLRDSEILSSWQLTLKSSAHGHTNLFGMLHILMGLTLPYCRWPRIVLKFQTIGLGLGSLAMGPGMLWRASSIPTQTLDVSGVVIGLFLVCALLGLASHFFGLTVKLLERSSF